MSRSLSSVVIVVLSIIAALGGGWMYMHSKARSKPIKTPFEHPYLKLAHQNDRPLLLFRASSPGDFQTPAADSKDSKVDREELALNLGFWLDVRLTGDGSLFISHDERLKAGPAKGKPIELATKAECAAAGLHELLEFAPVLKDRPTVLNLISRRPGLALRLLEVWGPQDQKDDKPLPLQTTVAQSQSDGTLKELREAQPRGLYGSSQAVLIQLEILSSLDLQGLAELKSDILISDIEERVAVRGDDVTASGYVQRPRLRTTTLKEAKRRGLRRYAGPTSELAIAKAMLADGYDGVLTDSEEIVQHFFPTFQSRKTSTH